MSNRDQDSHFQGETILIADDSPTALKVTSFVLEKSGYKVIQVNDGEKAVTETFNQKPHAVVVDLKMPKKDGYQVCREIKQDKNFYFPILLLTAREDIESMVKGLDSGADDYIVKPFNDMEFIARIRVLLRLKKLNDELLFANKRLEFLSTHDELTDLYNHRFFIQKLNQLFTKSKKEKINLCLAIFDIDNFKHINDSYGHLEGDYVLNKIAKHLNDTFDSDVIIARYGGEEFTALFTNQKNQYAINSCQKVIDACAKLVFNHKDEKYKVTLSGGLSSIDSKDVYNANDLIQLSDQLLYNSKRTGKNKLSY
ncbi:MAG: response regulator/GGDEF protein [uncultured bacterium]|nr:MAG: response regulator/GGDEF protein [uncultured bacterium]